MDRWAKRKSTSSIKLLVLTFSGVFIEIAYCVWALTHLSALWMVPLLLGAYHLGYLLSRSRLFNDARISRWGLLASLAGIMLGTYISSFAILVFALLGFSAALQSIRKLLKPLAKMPSKNKNLVKALAMALGSLGALPSVWGAGVIALLSLLIAYVIKALPDVKVSELPRTSSECRIRPILLWFELLHHAHYFAYCYTFWALLGPGFTPFIGPLFILGWIFYFMIEYWLRERSLIYNRWLLQLGHLVCAAALGGMLIWKHPVAILLLWTITGIGGGTAYMLGNIKQSGDRELYEDVGHVVGCGAGAVALFSISNVTGSIGAAMVLAIASAMILFLDEEGDKS